MFFVFELRGLGQHTSDTLSDLKPMIKTACRNLRSRTARLGHVLRAAGAFSETPGHRTAGVLPDLLLHGIVF